MASIEFYDVKIRAKVKIDEAKISKTTYTSKNNQVRYAIRGKTDDGRNLTKFVSKSDWETMSYPEEK